jgi:hypothetical protein
VSLRAELPESSRGAVMVIPRYTWLRRTGM